MKSGSSSSPWEALDVDDSDLPSLNRPCFSLLPCKRYFLSNIPPISQTSPPLSPPKTLSPQSQPHNDQSHSTSSTPHLIPGPAAAVQSAMHRINRPQQHPISTQDCLTRFQEEDDDFNQNPWLCAINFISKNCIHTVDLSSLNTCTTTARLPHVVAVVKSCRPNGFGDLILTLKDPSGTVNANVHRKVLKESQYGADITVQCVLILHKVAVFSSRRAHCLNITLNNVVKVLNPLESQLHVGEALGSSIYLLTKTNYKWTFDTVIRKDSGPPPTKEQAPSPVGFAVSGAGECRDTRAGMVDKAAFTKWRVAERLMSAAVKRHTNSQGSVEENQQLETVNPVEQSSSCKFKRSLVEVEALLVSQGAHRRHATRTGPTDGNEQMADNEDLSLAGASLKKFNFSKSIPQEFSAATKLSAHHTDFMSQGSERGAANAMSIDTIDGVDKQMVGNENIPSAVASLENSNLCESEHQHSSAATNFVDQHAGDGEPGRTNGVAEQMQQLPIWTDEQLGELFEDL